MPGRQGEPSEELMTEKGEPMLLMGLLTPAEVMGGREVMEAAAEGTSGGERWPDGGEDTDELSGLRESDETTRVRRYMNENQVVQKSLMLLRKVIF